ncbi:hypothetical protein ACVXHB_30070 [Escherichia coli]
MPTLENWRLDLQGISEKLDGVKWFYVCSPTTRPGNSSIAGFRTLLELTRGKALWFDEAYMSLPTGIAGWLAGGSATWLFWHIVESFCFGGAWLRFLRWQTKKSSTC